MDRTEDRSKEPKTKLVLDDGRIESIQEFISPEELYQDLIERVRKYHPSGTFVAGMSGRVMTLLACASSFKSSRLPEQTVLPSSVISYLP